MGDKNTDSVQEFEDFTKDEGDIFEGFGDEGEFLDDSSSKKEEIIKNKYYYLSKTAKVFQSIFWLFLFIIGVLYTYIYIQNNTEISDNNMMDPICNIFIGDINTKNTFCSSISYLKNTYTTELSTIIKYNVEEILKIVVKVYDIENFTKSKDITFLVDTSMNKLKVKTILEEFDKLKNKFDSIDKQKIQCSGLKIDSKAEILSMKCVAYSAGYEKGIRGFDTTVESSKKGTSLSIANSFINYIEKIYDIEKKPRIFKVIDRQKRFISENIIGDKSDFTKSTNFTLKLKYNLY